jgi:hypothetical protein
MVRTGNGEPRGTTFLKSRIRYISAMEARQHDEKWAISRSLVVSSSDFKVYFP